MPIKWKYSYFFVSQLANGLTKFVAALPGLKITSRIEKIHSVTMTFITHSSWLFYQYFIQEKINCLINPWYRNLSA